MAAILGVGGLIMGSFLGLVSLRVPAGRDIVFGRSRCGGCDVMLAPQHMVPVVSYLCLGGRCARCRSPIPVRYPLIETAAAAVGVCAGIGMPSPFAAVLLAIWGWLWLLRIAISAGHRQALLSQSAFDQNL